MRRASFQSDLVRETQHSSSVLPDQCATDTPGLLAAIVSCVGQDAALLHGKRLHCFIGVGKAPVCEVEIARLFNEALQFHSTAPIAVLFAQAGQGSFDRFAVLSCRLLLDLGQDHALLKQRQNEGKLLLPLRLTSQDAASLLGLAAPLPISVRIA